MRSPVPNFIRKILGLSKSDVKSAEHSAARDESDLEPYPHAPYFVFLKASGILSDAEVLSNLGLIQFRRLTSEVNPGKPRLYLTGDSKWIHIADDWLYSLWHLGKERGTDAAEMLHAVYPGMTIFSCSIGDCDRSFEFACYMDGALRRRYVVESRSYDLAGRQVVENYGNPFAEERRLPEVEDEFEYVLSLASARGINVRYDLASCRCYSSE